MRLNVSLPIYQNSRGKAVPATKFHVKNLFTYQIQFFFKHTGGRGEAAGEEGFVERDMVLRPDISPRPQPRGQVTGHCRLFMMRLTVKKSQYRLLPETFLNELLICTSIGSNCCSRNGVLSCCTEFRSCKPY